MIWKDKQEGKNRRRKLFRKGETGPAGSGGAVAARSPAIHMLLSRNTTSASPMHGPGPWVCVGLAHGLIFLSKVKKKEKLFSGVYTLVLEFEHWLI